MAINTGNYKIDWVYDANKRMTRCIITTLDGVQIIKADAYMNMNSNYDKVRAKVVSFKKAIKEISDKKLLSSADINEIINKFVQLPNKGVI